MTKRIDLPEDDPHFISKLICYCYTTDYKFDADTAIAMGSEHALRFPSHFHAGMYAKAEKFDLKNLKKLAREKFVTTLHCLEPGVNVATPGNKTLTRILEVVCFIYSMTLENDRGLRDLVVGYVARNSHAFLALQQFKTFMAANTDFIMEVMEAKGSICSRCNKHAPRKQECSSLGSYDGWR